MKKVLVCLHGWGGSKESFTALRSALKGSGITMLTPDLPGFGKEPEPKKPWSVDDYADWVEKWIQKQMPNSKKQIPIFLLGHSHGGRIAIKLATRKKSKFKIGHLFLCASAGIRHSRHFKRIIGLTMAKTGGLFLKIPGLSLLQPLGKKLLYKLVRVHDYEQASPVMRETLIKVTREDLRPLLRKIQTPTDLFWGKQDRMTPFKDGLIMERSIQDASLHAFDGVRHGVHREKAKQIAKVIKEKAASGGRK